LDLDTDAGLRAGLDAAIRIKGPAPYLKKLSGAFSYDIRLNPEYMHCLQMKHKLNEVRQIVSS
jgi:hypothetical protein